MYCCAVAVITSMKTTTTLRSVDRITGLFRCVWVAPFSAPVVDWISEERMEKQVISKVELRLRQDERQGGVRVR